MYKEYILKNGNETINYKISGNTLYEKIQGHNAAAIADNISGTFSLSVYQNTKILFYKTVYNELITSVNGGNGWQSRRIYNPHNGSLINAYMYSSQGKVHLLFTTQSENKTVLISQIFVNGNNWESSEIIDEISKSTLFDVRREKDIIIIFYENTNSVFGYRTIKNFEIGEFTELNKMSPFISDISYIYDNGTIHILYAVKSMLSGHLYYKRKSGREKESVIILSDVAAKKCCIYKIKNILYCLWIAGENTYIRESSDEGGSFSSPRKLPVSSPNKAGMVAQGEICAFEVFVKNSEPIHINEFSANPDITAVSNNSKPQNQNNGMPQINSGKQISQSKLENHIAMLIAANTEKDRQIAMLTQKVSSKQHENVENEIRLIKEIRRLQSENESLRKEINILREADIPEEKSDISEGENNIPEEKSDISEGENNIPEEN